MKNLVALFLSWAFIFFMVITCAHSGSDLPEKDVVAENAKKGAGSNISINPVAANNLEQIYGSTKKELPFCLFGSKNADGEYKVKRLGVPLILSSEIGGTTYKMNRCRTKENFLGIVHNHERGSCYPSQVDIQTFSSSDNNIFMVYCKKQGDPIYVGITRDIFDEGASQ